MGWFKKLETDAEKIDKLLSDFNATYKYISKDGKMSVVLDDVNQILGYINLDYGSGELETMRYSEIEAINYDINSLSVTGVFDLECMNKKDAEEFVALIKKDLISAIDCTELFYSMGLNVQTVLREREFPINFFFCGLGKPPVSKSKPLVQSSIEKYIEFSDLLNNTILMVKEGK